MFNSPAETGTSEQSVRIDYERGPLKHARDFFWLLRGELFLLREAWFWYLFQAAFVPVSYLFFLWVMIGRQNPQSMSFFITGSLVMSLSFAGMLSLGQHLGALKDYQAFDHYATLPIAKWIFLAAIATRGMLLTLPSALLILLIGSVFFGLVVSPIVFVVLLLSAYAMCGLGAIIGFWSPTAQIAGLTTQILQTVIVLFAPIFYPLEILPPFLQFVAHLWPTTYAAEALRKAMHGETIATLWPPLSILCGFVAVSLVLVPIKLDWRSRA